MRKLLSLIIFSCLLIFGSQTCFAAGFENFTDYENGDGTYSYYFEEGIQVILSEEWYKNTFVIADGTGATFYHKDSYNKYKEEGIEGGRLFTIGASVNSGFQNLPSYIYIGFNDETAMNYFAALPSDYQGYMNDQEVRKEYDALWKQVRNVVENIRISGNYDDQGAIPANSMFTRVENKQFSFEVPTNWMSWEVDGTIFASKSGTPAAPSVFFQKLDTNLSDSEYVDYLKTNFMDTYRDGIVEGPEYLEYNPVNTNRLLKGIRGVVSSVNASRQYTVLEYVEDIDGSLYHCYCTFVSDTTVDGEHEDETTFFEFLHAIDSFKKTA